MATSGVVPVAPGRPSSIPQEIDTCRICRGEGSADEPLFHPCKCSGSIMYVHQDCLMEWLSHSQKKHCELCKTSFTFTKLYHPHMPSTLPTSIFLRKAAGHVVSRILYWARGTLVALTWLFWLPWTMRFVWWGLFWLADMGWVNDVEFQDGGLVQTNLSRSITNATTIARQSLANEHAADRLPRLTLVQFFVWLFEWSAHVEWSTTPTNQTVASDFNMTASLARVRARGTLLSGLPLFTHPVLDRIATDILEGLVITMSLVAAIVLVLLIREWVVQQQPIINMGVDDNGPNPLPDRDEDERDIALDNAADDTQQNPPDGTDAAAASENTTNIEEEPAADELHADFEVDPSLTEWTQIVSLCEDANKISETLVCFNRDDLGMGRNWGGDIYATQLCASLVIRYHETHLALAQAADHAEKEADTNAIDAIRHKVVVLREALRFLSDSEADKLEQSISVTMSRIDDYARSTAAQPNASNPEAPQTPAQESSDGYHASNGSEAPQPRPSMPAREESFLATEIQRRLQESVEEGPSSRAVIGLGGRSDSNGSWQEIRASDADPGYNGESGTGYNPTSPAEVSNDDSPRVPRARSRSVPNPQRGGSINLERPAPRAEFWSRRARPVPSRPRSTDHITTGDEIGSFRPSLRRASSSIGDLEGRIQREHGPRRAEIGTANILNNANAPILHSPAAQYHESENRYGAPPQATQDQDPWLTRALDWLYGDIAPAAENARHAHVNDEHVVDDIADEEPFVPVNAVQEDQQNQPAHPVEENEVAAPNPNQGLGRPALVPNEAELIDEAEELEGVLELIGMQGPITGLFTNALFAAVFVSCTTTLAVWVPFLTGKLVIVGLAHPITLGDVIFRAGSGCINLFVDFCIFTIVYALQWFLNIPLNWVSAWKGFTNNRYETPFFGPMSSWSIDLLNRTYVRLSTEFSSVVRSTGAASSHLTLDSHTALSHIKAHVYAVMNNTACATISFRQQVSSDDGNLYFSVDTLAAAAQHGLAKLVALAAETFKAAKQLPRFLWAGQVTLQHSSGLLDSTTYSPAWSALDRSLTVTIGYIALGICAGIYFTRIAPIATSRDGRKMENMVLEVLQQTGGVSKVVLIISIEMLAFPLYCGLLLDIATLPLFGFSSIDSRISFTLSSPWTSVFCHWFIGTCYMFHFALFVAMCRKILRKGVLYFIRDPDDPTFHPVRDVLERSVASQLRKIMSSAMIYGGLVIVCLGSVLWLLAFGISGILPIRWSSESNFLSFPVDLVVYTTLKPVLVRFIAPSDWVRRVYEWWFKRSARVLRLSHYLFGDDIEDERVQTSISKSNDNAPSNTGSMSGRWVRVPNNDQVRVGKDRKAWTEVDENNRRLDGQPEPQDAPGVGPNDPNFTKVYVPSHFRFRIAMFFASLWALTAGAGFALTVLPLLCGRSLFAILLPKTLWANDIYAFSVGLFTLGAVVMTAVRVDLTITQSLLSPIQFWHAVKRASRRAKAVMSEKSRRFLRCVYVYGSVAIVMPCLFALLGEFYILGPLHTWFSDGKVAHTVQLLRSWTLGVQYLRVVLSIIQWNSDSTAARAFRAVTARGYFDPDASKATRYFFLPIMAASTIALLVPIPIGAAAAWAGVASDNEARKRLISSLAYPAVLATGLVGLLLRATLALLRGWQMHVRDEVYLIGERLHNYGERIVPKMKTA